MFIYGLGVIAWIVFALWPAYIAKRKGYSFILFLLLGILISFVLTLIIAALLKDKTMTSKDKADDRAVEAALDKEEAE